MVGCLVGKGAECSDVHSERIEDTTPLRPRHGTSKGQDLDVERFIAVLKPCELYGDGESRHVVFSLCDREVAKGLLWLKVSSERGYMSSLEMEQRLFVCVCVCCVFASFCKGVVVFLLVTGLAPPAC